MRVLEAIPDLSEDVEILNYRAVFNGPYSAVYRGKLKISEELVAIKIVNPIHGTALHTIRRKINRERATWGILQHPNILPLYGFADDNDFFEPYGAFISPWRQRGDMAQYLHEQCPFSPLEERLKLWTGVVAGIAYLHLHNPVLIHGDLKPVGPLDTYPRFNRNVMKGNVLIDDGGNAQICDFGLVRVFLEHGSSGTTTTTAHTGTERYLAYELVMAETAVPTTATDMYAVGCIGLELLIRQSPYAHHPTNLRWFVLKDMQAGIPPAVRPVDLAPELSPFWGTLSSCWARNSTARPTAHMLSAQLENMTTGEASMNPTPITIMRTASPDSSFPSESMITIPRSVDGPPQGGWSGYLPPVPSSAWVEAPGGITFQGQDSSIQNLDSSHDAEVVTDTGDLGNDHQSIEPDGTGRTMWLSLEPSDQISFRGPFTSKARQKLRMKNLADQPVAFKMMTTRNAAEEYYVRPSCGRVDPGSSIEVAMMLKSDPLNMKLTGWLLVKSTKIPPGMNVSEMWAAVASDKSIKVVHQKLKFVRLPAAPSTGEGRQRSWWERWVT